MGGYFLDGDSTTLQRRNADNIDNTQIKRLIFFRHSANGRKTD
jgi:hypothetical protein